MFQHLVAVHAHIADWLFGNDFLLEDGHLDLVIGPAVLIPELQSFLVCVIQQANGLLPAAVIKVGDHVHLHVVFPGVEEIILKMSLSRQKYLKISNFPRLVSHLQSLAVVDGVYEPEVMDGRVLQEVFRIIKLDVDSC